MQDCMGCQTGSDGRPGLVIPCELCRSGSLTDSKPLPFEFEWWLFSNAVKPRGCLSWPLWPLRGINKTAWAAKLVLTAGLAYPVCCASLGHLLMANLCPLSLNVCFTPPTAPQPPPPPCHPPTPPPCHPPTPYRLNPCYYRS